MDNGVEHLVNVKGSDYSAVMDIVSRVVNALQYSRDLPTVMHDIIELVIEVMEVQACTIHLVEEEGICVAASGGVDPENCECIKPGAGPDGIAADTCHPCEVVDFDIETGMSRPAGAVFEQFRSMLSMPMMDGNNMLGVLSIYKNSAYKYSDQERIFLSFVATQLVGTIRNTQLYEEVIRGFREMTTIHQVGQILNSVLEMEELLPTIARTCADHMSARGCVLRMLDENSQNLIVQVGYGFPEWFNLRYEVGIDEGTAGEVFQTGAPVVRNGGPTWVVPSFGAPEDVMESVICVPIVIKGTPRGTLCVFGKESSFSDSRAEFQESEAGLVMMIASQVALALENARLFESSKMLAEEKDTRIKELSLLLEITNIMRSSLDFEELLYIILTSVTMGEGLGFNRAALFLTQDGGRILEGRMAVGPMDPESADKHWHAIEPKGKTLSDLVREWGQFNMTAGFKIDKIIKKSRIPVLPERGILARTVIERTSFNVVDYRPEPGSEEAVLSEVGFTSFATVPLMAQDHPVGVIVVDNLITKNPIDEDDVQFLKLFANQAATTIEISQVYKNLETTNRRLVDARDLLVRTKTLATLGEFSAGVAHELRNPLVSIGGFAKRLVKMLGSESKEARYASIISREVEGMEKILGQILEFVGGAKPDFSNVDVSNLIEQVLILFNELIVGAGIKVETVYDDRVRNIHVDEVQMRQLFINLIKNAIEAMRSSGGELKITSAMVEGEDGGIGFEISDTGVGIPEEDISHIFDPFFTKKDTGTGLGLPICSRIVETNHGGRIFVDSKLGQGTSIYIWLPQDVLGV